MLSCVTSTWNFGGIHVQTKIFVVFLHFFRRVVRHSFSWKLSTDALLLMFPCAQCG
jgi:hypothetical protein